MLVVKRNGSVEDLNEDKITKAILMAFAATPSSPIPDPKPITRSVTDFLAAQELDERVSVEEIQDLIENALISEGYVDVAKKFISFRQERDRARRVRLKAPKGIIPGYINAAKYAKWQENLLRRETEDETIDRYRDMLLNKFPDLEEKIIAATDAIRAGEILPSMRALQFGGVAMEVNNERGYNCSFTFADRPEVFRQSFPR